MDVSRRHLLNTSATALAAGAAGAVATPASAAPLMSALGRDATQLGVRPGSPDDQTRALQRAVDDTARTGTPLALPPGVYRTRALRLPANAHLVGVRGATRLEFAGGGPSLLTSEGASNVSLTALTLDGSLIGLPSRRGLFHCENGREVRVVDCEFIDSGANAIWFDQVSGEVRNNIFRNTATTAFTSFDAQGLLVAQNTILGTRSNGIEIIRHQMGDDGTLVIDNRLEDIVAGPGGSGQYGNAINAYRAANVIVRGNRIRNCDFSAIRGNSASNIQIVGNSVTDVREVALYSEFGFEGAIIANNVVDMCAIGAVAANFNEGGRIAVVQGNILRNVFNRRKNPAPDDRSGIAISVEADVSVTGNVIENAESFGIYAGWGRYLRDVAITGNVIRTADVGIALSVAPGAGPALVHSNIIDNVKTGGVIGFDHYTRVTGELTPDVAAKHPQLSIGSNLIR
ncbi:TIGR03808 family TAT-translocated repetitive protein [Bradyrhizobium sp. LHD-71]|uniref:TIGR03808 family TAT-translocated repetitive protein n=1 Tax=Bradyrhizobium sp. LHD-71 TaxID=3072141 RepID=UPI00280C91D5|nr:TIGR03808 family TAT-translocated repetitive protein [Bradyrhizobium sp. LHD-71]MDQ8729362.1 TIGR03808 family TAT-translocated repetitive protein [Bradyrhizobium sp. LHD-71]